MSTIKHYALVQERSPSKLVATVTRAIGKGFVPSGGISVTTVPSAPESGIVIPHVLYCQAMVQLLTPQDSYGIVKDTLPESDKVDGLVTSIMKAMDNPPPAPVIEVPAKIRNRNRPPG